MKPQLLRLSKEPTQSFNVRQDVVPDVNNKWHYHVEVELIHFNKGKGTQFVGDSINRFQPGDVVLIGSEMPHISRFDDQYFEPANTLPVDIRVAHFQPNFFGEVFLNLPENKIIRELLEKAKRGIKITGQAKKTVATLMGKMLQTDGFERMLMLMEALHEIAKSPGIILLSSMGFKLDFKESERVSDIYAYTFKHFKEKISLEEIAQIANVSPNSFCRFFKSKTGKTFSQFILELKVGHACKLLIEDNYSIKQICYESGFNNSASFYKYFKTVTGNSPSAYQKEFLNKSKVVSLFTNDELLHLKKAK
ncbi:AraC-like DNA-binding protein [Arcticibacter pallidicorallinus]|uniref:AraC-like DNA-binding protein n=1 Tax=Arcticibacter pallidicorallinus TaxID=1259464 RepID=A0A2T0U5U3_9SPHI|nr:AraC family transcriptional regulator [Arcticibacter pallidicorallinus]PRY53293.1 AraC-like DNA-binding protein [Arcticibacter pallidicorallinus]